MDTLVTIGAIVTAIALKLVFFFLYAKHAEKKGPKKAEPFKVIQKGPAPADKDVKRILVTGGCGLVGSSIVRQLQDRLGSRVVIVVLDIAIHTKFGPLLPDVTYYQGDICTYSHLRTATADCACVVHTAGVVSDCLSNDAVLQRVCEQGTRNVVEACLERDIGALVYTSSTSVLFSKSAALALGGGGTVDPVLETSAPLPADDLVGGYARSKAAAERLVLAASSHALHVVALRPGGVYGLGDPYMMSTVLTGKPSVGPGDVRVPFVWVEDAARGHVDAVEQLVFPKPGAKRIHGRAYHLCHDPVRDPFYYREFFGGALEPHPSSPKHAAVKAAEAEAGIQDPPPGVNAYGMKCNFSLPSAVVRVLAHINFFVGQRLGVVAVSRGFTPDNLLYAVNHWPCDVADARQVLGWEPTPWRVVAARLGEDAGVAGCTGFRPAAYAVGTKTKVA